MSKESIVTKALQCIDEVYPFDNDSNMDGFPTEAFIDEVVRWVIDVVPPSKLTNREELGFDSVSLDAEGVGKGTIEGGTRLGRLVYFLASGWKIPALGAITEDNILYRQQKNRVLRGNPSRPVVAITENRSILEWYTAKEEGEPTAYHVPYDVEFIPTELVDLAAWKLAETVLLSMSDAQSAATCTAKVNEQLQMLML